MFTTTDDIEVAASQDDISIFVRKQMKAVGRLRTIIKGDTQLEEHIVSQIIEKAQARYAKMSTMTLELQSLIFAIGSFLMASHHMNSLSQTGSKAETRQALNQFPSKVKDAYDLTMKRIRAQPELDRLRAERTLSLFFGLRRSQAWNGLWMIELRHALATLSLYEHAQNNEVAGVDSDDLPDADFIIQCCQGLMIFEGRGQQG